MDGTFLTSQKTYNREHFMSLYQKMREQGIHFVVASGNQYYQLVSFFEEIKEEISFVAENGAWVISEGQELFSVNISEATFQQTLKILDEFPEVEMVVCGKESAYIHQKESQAYFDEASLYYHHLKWVESFDALYEQDQWLKFGLSFPSAEEVPNGLIQLNNRLKGELKPISSGGRDVDLILPETHKANGIQLVQKHLGISQSSTVAFGDSGNDLEMIQYVEKGYAMKNAAPELLAVSDCVTSLTNNESGVLKEIEKLLEHQ